MNCECKTRLNESLKPKGLKLGPIYSLVMAEKGLEMNVTIPLVTLEGKKPKASQIREIIANFCPFCGAKTKTEPEPKNENATTPHVPADSSDPGNVPQL